MKITFNQKPSVIRGVAGSLTDGVQEGTRTHQVLAQINEAVQAQIAGLSDPAPQPAPKGASGTAPAMPATEIELDVGQWRIFKDALLANAFGGDKTNAMIMTKAAKTISVGLETEG